MCHENGEGKSAQKTKRELSCSPGGKLPRIPARDCLCRVYRVLPGLVMKQRRSELSDEGPDMSLLMGRSFQGPLGEGPERRNVGKDKR